MRGSGILTLLGAIVGALIIADLWAHPRVTNSIIGTSYKESQLIAGK